MGQSFSKAIANLEFKKYIETSGQREIGIISIVAYFRLISKITKIYKIDVPPVLISIVGVIGGLECIKSFHSNDLTDQILYFLNPAAGM